MTRIGKVAALAVVVVLLTPPLAAVSNCWQTETERAACPGKCPMPHSKPAPVKAERADGGCCEISSTEPTPANAALLGLQKFTSPVVVVKATGPVSVLTNEAGAQPPESPPPAKGSSLTTLYCVFLI